MKTLRFIPLAGFLLTLAATGSILADDSSTPGSGYDGGRYANLWTKSPFAIATPDAPAATTDYQLVGIAQFDGVSYATLIERESPQEHFVVSSDKPFKNVTLVSITPGKGGTPTTALIQRNGEPLTLTLEEAPANPVNGASPMNAPTGAMPMNPQIMQMNNGAVGGIMYPNMINRAPRARFHRPPINVPPPPPAH